MAYSDLYLYLLPSLCTRRGRREEGGKQNNCILTGTLFSSKLKYSHCLTIFWEEKKVDS